MHTATERNSYWRRRLQTLTATRLGGVCGSNTLYHNILDRAPDQGDMAYWVSQMQAGTLNDAQVLASFSESNENKIALTGAIQNGIEYLAA
ncbi:DUF4214 domain-containing protein [Pseudomonas asturiensis]|uniref:DUF4214 domain-containing protein n=1 Tax=Pseudomonas asturiensis TaxID=1190415 RepID=UPI002481F6C6|nr:DUF4214 domain-containing protein [Pseudomonas asturiensis]